MQGVLTALAAESGRSDILDEMRRPADPMPPPAPEVAPFFAEALRHTESGGNLAKAARTLEKALQMAPEDVACLGLGIMIQTMRGNRALAEAYGRRAVALAPRVAALHINLGNCLRDQRKYEEALSCYGEALVLAPEIIQTRFNVAQCLGQLDRRDEAETAWRAVAALPAETLPARICRGAALVALDRLAEAEPLLLGILDESPSHGLTKMELATVYRRTRRYEKAEDLLLDIVRGEPDNWGAYLQLSGVYHDMSRFADAEKAARQAMKRNPDDPNVLIVFANALSDNGNLQEAERLARQALSMEPGEGLASHRHVLGMILERQGRYDEAGVIFEAVAAAEPDKGWAPVTLAFHLLRQGDFARGWEAHERRWEWEQNPEPPRTYPQPQWTRAARRNSRVLIWAEQGLGDTVQFMRFVTQIADLGYRPILEVAAPLKALTARMFGFPTFARGETVPEFDYHIPFLSACHALGVTMDTIPGRTGYLRAEEDGVAKWRDRLRPAGEMLIGLSWAGNPMHANDMRRSIPLDLLAPLFAVEGVRFVSLQKDVRDRDQPALARFAGRLDSRLIEESRDLDDSTGLIANLDLVISIDGGAAHLAAAMGKPVWMLLPFCPDWRWLTEREDSIWYESVRLFRQPAPADWAPVLSRVETDLRALTGRGQTPA